MSSNVHHQFGVRLATLRAASPEPYTHLASDLLLLKLALQRRDRLRQLCTSARVYFQAAGFAF